MKCPIDQTTLAITDRQGIEIDYCPTCRGVWLDRGELDKMIEKGGSNSAPIQTNHSHQSHSNNDSYKYHKKHRKESFLSDMFDF